jgi:hypothetical protein
MKDKIADLYGKPRTIRYLVGSIDDLREVAETVQFMIKQHSKLDDARAILKNIPVMAIPLPHSVSSFILGMRVPCNLLKRSPQDSRNSLSSNKKSRFMGLEPNPGSDMDSGADPVIKTERAQSSMQFQLIDLLDLSRATIAVIRTLQSRTDKFTYATIKRRARLTAKPLAANANGFTLIVEIPYVLQET